MKKYLLLVFLFILSLSSFRGQLEEELKSILSRKDFSAFKSYADKHSNNANLRGYWEYLRELTSGYKEGVYVASHSSPIKGSANSFSVKTYRVEMIVFKNDIIYYKLAEEKFKEKSGEWEPYFIILSDYKNDLLYQKLQDGYKTLFGADLNEKELFKTSIVYGAKCGIAGQDPDERTLVNEYVMEKNRSGLLKLLQSTNTERQIYGIDGFHQLKTTGLELSKTEKQLINLVLQKNGTVQTCSGCTHLTREIKEVVKQFNFN